MGGALLSVKTVCLGKISFSRLNGFSGLNGVGMKVFDYISKSLHLFSKTFYKSIEVRETA